MNNIRELDKDRRSETTTETYVPCTCQICGRRALASQREPGFCRECATEIYAGGR